MEMKGRREDCDVPDTVWLEILSKLPQKSKFKFRCVSKTWNLLISDTYYMATKTLSPWNLLVSEIYFKDTRRPVVPYTGIRFALPQHSEFTSIDFSLKFLPPQENGEIRVLASSNGLLLCGNLSGYTYYVCNPLTAQYVSLPDSASKCELAGVGFLSTDRDYKVVQIRRCYPVHDTVRLRIFSSDVGEWKSIELSCPLLPRIDSESEQAAVFFNDTMHFFASPDIVVACDLHKEQCRLIHLPKTGSFRLISDKLLRVCNGQLQYLQSVTRFVLKQRHQLPDWDLIVRKLDDYDAGEWSIQVKIPMGQCGPTRFRVLAFHPFDVNVIYGQRQKSIFCFNLETWTFERVNDEGFPPLLRSSAVFPFVLPPWPKTIPQPTWKTIP
ncbi:F-box protein At5g49610-like [Mercurialis annua]|uniref:F-box protein At5g49610-like n=1 Tax=Mercurialis annua TaxID=3986 RepID=UPI002160AF75|nr:F-box protein At5g49610-like [Mercurialis annua]